jgi:uncharacterized repeat protein (TIGR03803 family)
VIAGLGCIPAGQVSAQSTTILHSFNNSDGANPECGLILSGDTLYGTTWEGGTNGTGAVFKVNRDGSSFANLHSFAAITGGSPPFNTDGVHPSAGLILSGSILYGTAWACGANGSGTVFAVKTNGTGFETTYNFTLSAPNVNTNLDGAYPLDGLILSGDTLYGTATRAGVSGNGTVFAVNTNGSFRTLYNFNGTIDGGLPAAGLILSDGTLYGTTQSGGKYGNGTVFAINTNGAGFTNLYSFTAASGSNFTNSDGASPLAGLILSGNTLYGTAPYGGSSGNGAVFKVYTNGTGFTNLHNFVGYPNGDGSEPFGGLITSGNTLYGTTYLGGAHNRGTAFAIHSDGTDFTNLYSFGSYFGDGASPYAGLILSENTLYGTTYNGGTNGNGSVFSLSLPPPPPQLAIIFSGANVILTWPTNGFTLEFATNLVSTTIWKTNSTVPIVLGGENVVTNLTSGTQKFYRLIK